MPRISIISIVIAVAAVAAVAFIGSRYTDTGPWYRSLTVPAWKPPDWAFPVAWTIIFALEAVSIVLIWNARPHASLTYAVMGLFVVNGVLNVLWSMLFFANRQILPGVWDAFFLFLSVVALILVSMKISVLGAILLIPYALWTAFATVLTWMIYRLNP